MKRSHLLISVGLAASVGLVSPAAFLASPAGAAVPAIDAFGVDVTGTGLVTLSTSAPGTVSTAKAITGLSGGETILGIDVRPTTGELFGLGSTSRLYVINPTTAAATAVGPTFTPALNGTSFGFDFNPAVDRIRVTSNLGQDLRLNPSTGAVAFNDPALNGDVASIDGSAYTNSAGTAATTTLYGISATTGSLYIQTPPNDGTQTLVGPTGLVGLLPAVGFDILVSGSTNKGVAALNVAGIGGLYEIDLTSGAATLLGTTGQVLSAFALAGPGGYCGADFDAEVACVGGAGGAARPSLPNPTPGHDIVDAVQTPSGQGVWQVAFDGGIFVSGDAAFLGSTGGVVLKRSVVGMAATPSGNGYWLVGADGGVFSYGDAGFFGSVPGVLAPGQQLSQDVVGIASTGTGKGYWMVAEDGGIFAFGDAAFLGSVPGVLPPGQQLSEPVVQITRNEVGPGYYMVAFDGGVFAFGAPFLGSAGGLPLVAPITDIAAAGPTGGYRIFGADGGIFTYGGASFKGSIPNIEYGVGLAG